MTESACEKKVKASFPRSNAINKDEFVNEHVMLLISVGKKKHYNHYFKATIELINKSNFSRCTMLVCDTLQRYNLMMESTDSAETAILKSKAMGDEWIQRNKAIYTNLTMAYNIIRWDYWLIQDNYNKKKIFIENLFKQDKAFNQAIITTAHEYSGRQHKHNLRALGDDACLNLSVSYLLEECAAMLLWPHQQYHYELYPSERNFAMTYIYEKFIRPGYPSLLKPLTLRFKKMKTKVCALDEVN